MPRTVLSDGWSFPPDGTRFVATFRDGTAILYDGENGKRLEHQPIRHSRGIFMAKFSADGESLLTAAGSRQGSIRVWDARTGELRAGPIRHSNGLKSIAVSPDGRRVLSGGYSNRGMIWNTESGKLELDPRPHGGVVEHVAFSPDGMLAVTCSRDGTVQLRDAGTGAQCTPPLQHRSQVRDAVFSQDGLRLITSGRENAAYVWDTLTGKRITEPIRLPRAVTSSAFSPSGESVVIGCLDGSAYVFEVAPGAALPLRFGRRAFEAAFDHEGHRIVTGSFTSPALVQIWDARTGHELTKSPMKHSRWVNDVRFSPDGRRILSGADDDTAVVWDIATEQPVFPPVRGGGRATGHFSADGSRVGIASYDGTARILDASTGQPVFSSPLRHDARVWRIRFSSDGRFVATASDDGTARLWNPDDGEALTPPLPHRAEVQGLAISPNSKLVATRSLDHSARLWEAESGTLLWEALHSGPVQDVSFSPDSDRLVSAALDNTAVIWDVRTGRALGPAMQHGKPVNRAQFSADGSRVLTSASDGSLRIWDGFSGKPLSEPIKGPGIAILHQVAPSGDRALVTYDRQVFVWDLPVVSAPAPSWLPDLAEAVGGKRFDAEGLLQPASAEIVLEFRERGKASDRDFRDPDFYQQWLRWFVANRETRTLSAWSSQTVADHVERLLHLGTAPDLRVALQLAPGRRDEMLVPLAEKLGPPGSGADAFEAKRCAQLARLAEAE